MPQPRARLDTLYAQRFRLWRELVNQVDFVRGSVVVLHRPCTRAHCPRCRSGERHSSADHSVLQPSSLGRGLPPPLCATRLPSSQWHARTPVSQFPETEW